MAKSKLIFIQLLKAIACLTVFNGHFSGAFIPCHEELRRSLISHTPLGYFFLGDLAVLCFWGAAGFLLEYAFIDSKQKTPGILDDSLHVFSNLGKRFLVLFVPSFVIIACTVLSVYAGILFNREAMTYGASQWFGSIDQLSPGIPVVFQDFWALITGQYSKNSVCPHLWYVYCDMRGCAILLILKLLLKEKFFYILIGMLILFRPSLPVANIAAGMLAAKLWLTPEFCSYFSRHRNLSSAFFIFAFLLMPAFFRTPWNLMTTLSIGILLFLGPILLEEWKWNSPLQRIVVFLGRESYSIYIRDPLKITLLYNKIRLISVM